MLTKTKMILAAVAMFGAASAAQAAADDDREIGGFQVQTWREIEQAKLAMQRETTAAAGANASAVRTIHHAHPKSR